MSLTQRLRRVWPFFRDARTGIVVALLGTVVGALTEPLWRTSRAVGLAPAGDSAAFAQLVDETLRERALLTRLGAAGRELYEGYFSLDRAIERLLAVD